MSTHCDGKLEGCERLEAGISMVTGKLRALPKTACLVRSFPSRTDLKGLDLQAISYIIPHALLSLSSDSEIAPCCFKDLIILKPTLRNWPTSLPVSNEYCNSSKHKIIVTLHVP